MIQFNLLPDVKLEYIKATYRRRVVVIGSSLVAGAFLLVFVLMFLFVKVNQERTLNNLDDSIDTKLSELQSNPDLDKILTVQNQLSSLPELHDQKVFSSRIFTYLTKVTPNNASITNVDVDFEDGKISLRGVANDLETVNKFVDTLKFTEYKVKGEASEPKNAFNIVVLEDFSIGDGGGNSADASVTYQISMEYDQQIFASTAQEGDPVANKIELNVPEKISTRSETEKPASLFENSLDLDDQEVPQ